MATTVKNTLKTGARGLRNEAGDLVMIEPGKSVSGDFSASEVKDFKAMLKGNAPAAEDESGEGGDDDGDAGPLSGSVASLKDHLDGINDVTEVEALLAGEQSGLARSTAIAALEARRDVLNAEQQA